jgi:hypothetical protein
MVQAALRHFCLSGARLDLLWSPTAIGSLAAGGSYTGKILPGHEAGAVPTLRMCGAVFYCLYTPLWHNA